MPHIIRIQSNESGCGRKIPAWIFFFRLFIEINSGSSQPLQFFKDLQMEGCLVRQEGNTTTSGMHIKTAGKNLPSQD